MPRVCIVEMPGHPAPETLERRLGAIEGFTARTVAAVPDPLDVGEALVLNNIPSAEGSIPEDQVLRFIQGGGGVFAIHDSVFPYAFNKAFVAACGIRGAYGATMRVATPVGIQVSIVLAVGDQADPTSQFPIMPAAESINHPILEGIRSFELAEEAWAQNLAPGVRALLVADIGDRVFAPERFQKGPMPVAACASRGEGRLAWFSLGHFGSMYNNPIFVQFTANALRW